GACARVMSPTTRMSSPIARIQSGIAMVTSPSGRPEEKESSATEAVRQERMDATMLRSAPGLAVTRPWLAACAPAPLTAAALADDVPRITAPRHALPAPHGRCEHRSGPFRPPGLVAKR